MAMAMLNQLKQPSMVPLPVANAVIFFPQLNKGERNNILTIGTKKKKKRRGIGRRIRRQSSSSNEVNVCESVLGTISSSPLPLVSCFHPIFNSLFSRFKANTYM
jgi:hypothetical protein